MSGSWAFYSGNNSIKTSVNLNCLHSNITACTSVYSDVLRVHAFTIMFLMLTDDNDVDFLGAFSNSGKLAALWLFNFWPFFFLVWILSKVYMISIRFTLQTQSPSNPSFSSLHHFVRFNKPTAKRLFRVFSFPAKKA